VLLALISSVALGDPLFDLAGLFFKFYYLL